ncbi:MAG TPA: response regulator transcription factor [Streptosporangiaceae bacterium]|nr:response regulator transcription factor [Streptosporangiaceae bacterium]
MAPVKLLIVDDHKVFAQGLEAIFRAEPDFAPLPAVTDPDRVLDVVASSRPDVVIMDVLLGEVCGLDLTAQLMTLPAPPVVVVLTAYADAVTAIGAVRVGATGFVPKDAPAEHVVCATRAAVQGGTWFPAGLLTRVLRPADRLNVGRAGQVFEQLTERELEVLTLIVSGLDKKGIARRLGLAPETVKTHIRKITAKLGTHSAVETVAVALKAGLRPE